jgi:multiple sugar transport system substrate-binding protein
MGRTINPLTGQRFSRRRAMQAGLGASATLAMAGLPGGWTPARAQDSAAADVTGDFDWKRHDGTTIKVLLNEHPYSDAMKANLQAFQDLTGITVQHDTFPETNYFDKLTVDLQSGQGAYDAFMLGAYMVWQYGPPGWLEDMNPWIENASMRTRPALASRACTASPPVVPASGPRSTPAS